LSGAITNISPATGRRAIWSASARGMTEAKSAHQIRRRYSEGGVLFDRKKIDESPISWRQLQRARQRGFAEAQNNEIFFRK